MRGTIILCLTVFCQISLAEFTEHDVDPSVEIGADVFQRRCVVCHGPAGMGEGLIPLKIKDYPNTQLVGVIDKLNSDQIRNAVTYGGSRGGISEFMPPMGNDLTWTQIESVLLFLDHFAKDYDASVEMIRKIADKREPSKKRGNQLFSAQCVLCHGRYGDGKGRMSKVIKSPPPANLIISRLPDEYLKKIIADGGDSVNRSPKMPPWRDQLSASDIESIILYIKSIRN